jgi:adenylate kinase
MTIILRAVSRKLTGAGRVPVSPGAVSVANVNVNINHFSYSYSYSNHNHKHHGSLDPSTTKQQKRSMKTMMTSSQFQFMNNNFTSIQQKKQQQQQQQQQQQRLFQTRSSGNKKSFNHNQDDKSKVYKPGSRAFAECETDAIQDLFFQFAQVDDVGGIDEEGEPFLCLKGVQELLNSIGEKPNEDTLKSLFMEADENDDGKLHLDEFLVAADRVLGGAPARIVIVVGGPGSGKGILCDRLADACGVVHLSSGDLLRDEVEKGTPLGREVAEIMERGELVSSAVITALIRRRTRKFPGRRILLDGFPRSVENAHDFLELMGKPELALHLDCDDTILMERIIKRQKEGQAKGTQRADDNFETGIQRLRTFHKYHHSTMDWLSEQHVPIVNLDCSGTSENVWNQLLAIGRLMRPATQLSSIAEPPALFDEGDRDVTTGT